MIHPFTNHQPAMIFPSTAIQWPLQEPKLEVPTIYKAYFLGLNFREYTPKYGPQKWYSNYVPPF